MKYPLAQYHKEKSNDIRKSLHDMITDAQKADALLSMDLWPGKIIHYTPEGPMTSEQAYKEIQKMRSNSKRKFSDTEKRALEYAMVMIAQKVGEDVLSRKEGMQ